MSGRRDVQSTATEDYLKVIWNAREWSDRPVTVGALAARLGLAPSSVSEVVRRLTRRGLLTHERYGAIALTEDGERLAVAIVRKHRLIETFLVEYLGYTWDEVHEEAERIEHAVSAEFVERLAARLGDPRHDPHGDPIPRADGSLPGSDSRSLDTVQPGGRVHVVRVRDEDPEVLRYLAERDIAIGTAVSVGRRHDAGGTMVIEHDGIRTTLGLRAAQAIRVTGE
jgi:DtxR family Mn-dependent transcriptional regulator